LTAWALQLVNRHAEVCLWLLDHGALAHKPLKPSKHHTRTHLFYEQPLHIAARTMPHRDDVFAALLAHGAR
jgi:hypothetical protein